MAFDTGANSQFFLFFLFSHQKKIVGRIEIRTFVRNNVHNGSYPKELCYLILVSGLCICLRSAAKITHKVQSVMSLGAKWHTCATIDSFENVGPTEETPVANISHRANYHFNAHVDSDMDEGEEDELENTKLVPVYRDTISYQKRQALGELEHSHPLHQMV